MLAGPSLSPSLAPEPGSPPSPSHATAPDRREETAAVSTAVQNLHLQLCAEGFAGYWSSGGVAGECAWANSPEVLGLLGLTGECGGEPDRVLGFFYVGACAPERAAAYKGRRGDVAEKITWL